ncbi:MAG TPA: YceI family protein [Terracidiphilus sp.]|nr:YceI family protein [Terracidiphilus sp.]
MGQSAEDSAKATEANLSNFTIDGHASRFTVQAFSTGLLSALGHNPIFGIRDFNGEVQFDPEHLKAGNFKLAIKSASLSVIDDISDKDRREIEEIMRRDVLETAKYPEIAYQAGEISVNGLGGTLYSALLHGALDLHGVAGSVPIKAKIAVMGDMMRASGDFSVFQSDFNIKPVSVAGGAIKIKDELKCAFEIVARR